jgi:hypothetical protein
VEPVDVCFNYGCVTQWPVQFEAARFAEVLKTLHEAQNAEEERARLAIVIGQLYRQAAEQTPIGNDRGGNYEDAGVWGRMDCIDHSTTTSRFLRLIEAQGGLRWHRVLEPVRRMRFFVLQHYSAAIEEIENTPEEENAVAQKYVVDSWFRDNGEPAVILPLEEWMKGNEPDV